MRRFCLLLMLCLLLAGCGNEDAMPTPPATVDIPTETAYIPGTVPDASAVSTVILRSRDEALRIDYTLMAISPEAPFPETEDTVTINAEGAQALVDWLTSREAQQLAGAFGREEYGDTLYYVNLEEKEEPEIPQAKEETRTIRLSAARSLCDSGVLDALLPVFQDRYGYTVEVMPDETFLILSTARRAEADVVLTASPVLEEKFLEEGFTSQRIPFVHEYYVLCGPASDPAKVADCGDIYEAFAAIAGGEHIFISRGDGYTLHVKEVGLWPRELGISTESSTWEPYRDWYVSADAETGPCITMAQMLEGYVLCDKLTYQIFYTNGGIL